MNSGIGGRDGYSPGAMRSFRFSREALEVLRDGLKRYNNYLVPFAAPGNAALQKKQEGCRRLMKWVDGHVRALAPGSSTDNSLTIEAQVLSELKSTLPYVLADAKRQRRDLQEQSPPQEAFEAIDRRISFIEELLNAEAWKDIPTEPIMGPVPVAPQEMPQARNSKYEYDVSLSYASENQAYVEAVARGIQEAGYSVFYAPYEKVKIWGNDQIEYFDEVYRKKSRFVIPFISSAYANKFYPRMELRSTLAGIVTDTAKAILPVRFDDTDLPGLPTSIGYLDATELTPDEIVRAFIQKSGNN